jgi:hypothetical protein
MKAKFYVLIITIVFFSCKKENNSFEKKLEGTWELSSFTSGLTGKNTSVNAGNGTIYKFTAIQFQKFDNGQLIKSGTFIIKKDTIQLVNRIGNKIIFNNESGGMFFELDESYLSFFIDAPDGGGTTYKRIISPIPQ